METVVSSSVDNSAELRLLTSWERDRGRSREAGVLSVLAHGAAIIGLLLIPRSVMSPPRRAETITPLIEPPTELTQKAPNTRPLSKEVTAEAPPSHAHLRMPSAPPAPPLPKAQFNAPPPTPPPAPSIEQPHIDVGHAQPPQNLPLGPPTSAPAAPQIQAQEKPKLAFETPTAPPPSGGRGSITRPDTSVEGAIEAQIHGGASGQMIHDDASEEMLRRTGTGISPPELLSDPMGVDFKPYLIQVLTAVRRNWFAVYPESARMGLRGQVETQFVIAKDGSVPKLVIVTHSAPALDRAAVAGIDASHPFPPFPSQFTGDRIVLKLIFSYNIPRR